MGVRNGSKHQKAKLSKDKRVEELEKKMNDVSLTLKRVEQRLKTSEARDQDLDDLRNRFKRDHCMND